MMKFKSILYLSFALASWQQVGAQQVSLKASMDSAGIAIGNQTQIHLNLTQDRGDLVELPYLSDTIVRGIEILGVKGPDTTDLGSNRIEIKLDYLVTSFDSALYYIPPFRAVRGGDTIYSNDLGLKVVTYEVQDTTQGAFFDIKPTYSAPFVWSDYHFIVLAIISALWIIVMVLYALQQRRRHGKVRFVAEPQVPLLPPDEEAMLQLEALKGEKLWQSGREKEYYTRMTDTLRHYLERRFGINAPEMTTSDILQRLTREEDLKVVRRELEDLLRAADFVKFAKQRPLPEENESALSWALTIVAKTKQQQQQPEEEIKA
ncbi:MAG: hypothetical protein ACRCZM_05190 [Bacteroidales bacterium]